MISRLEYEQAVAAVVAAQKAEHAARDIIYQYHRDLAQRPADQPLLDSELRYARFVTCGCGHGLAFSRLLEHPEQWDCSAVLKGIAVPTIVHLVNRKFGLHNYDIENGLETTRQGDDRRRYLRETLNRVLEERQRELRPNM